MTYAVTFQKTESGMDCKAHQIPEGHCLDAHRRQKLKNSHTLLNLYGGYVGGISAYSLFYPKEEGSKWRRNVSNHMRNQKVSHLRRPSPQRAFCFALVNWATGPGILPYLEARRTARGEQAICSSSIPWILSCQPQTKLRTEETSRLFDQITLFSK